ncbi:LysE family translocator [Curvibacter sp. APW13]|nr:LysE family translocator [Curvibacter sp. APW13]MDT8993053.1 LysE family translocator [Curvibacter sp. APW13]
MSSQEWGALLVLATATSFTPGPNTTLSTALAANRGLRAALPFVLAVPVGWGLMLALCYAGLGALVQAQPLLRSTIQWGGIAYLLWLASSLARSRTLAQADGARLQVGFGQGVALQFLNIKAWTLALTLVAQWLAGQPNSAARFAAVLPVMLAYAFSSNLAYALLGSGLRHWLSGPLRQGQPSYARLRGFNRSMAALLLFTALWMAAL